MQNKYISSQIMLACLTRPVEQKSIHAQLEETIAERTRIMQQLENFSRRARMIDMYTDFKKRVSQKGAK
jgi:hypothetical protein